MADSTQSDLVILLLGQTGAGKSTFINQAVGTVVSEVGPGPHSCTKDVKGFRITVPMAGNLPQRVILVDTPGFNDTYDEEVQILEKIREWLKQSCSNHSMKFYGIIYLHDISQTRNVAQGDSFITPENFKSPPLVENLHFVATDCNPVNSSTAQIKCNREEEYRSNNWRVMLERGAKASRFEGSQLSANKIISLVVQNNPLPLSNVSDEFDRIYETLAVPSSSSKPVKYGFFARLFSFPCRNKSR